MLSAEELAARRAVEDGIARECSVVRRAAWGAYPPTGPLEPDWNYEAIVVHYTGHEDYADMRAIQSFDIEHRHWSDVAYHYAVRPDGTTYEGRELVFKGSHVRNQNTGKVGIVCMGDYDSGVRNWFAGKSYDGDAIDARMLDSLERLSRCLIRHFPVREFGGHLEFGDSETCPGNRLLPRVQAMRTELGMQAPVHRSL